LLASHHRTANILSATVRPVNYLMDPCSEIRAKCVRPTLWTPNMNSILRHNQQNVKTVTAMPKIFIKYKL